MCRRLEKLILLREALTRQCEVDPVFVGRSRIFRSDPSRIAMLGRSCRQTRCKGAENAVFRSDLRRVVVLTEVHDKPGPGLIMGERAGQV